jgi:hypothetical protein
VAAARCGQNSEVLEALRPSFFEPHVGDEFVLAHTVPERRLTLDAVNRHPTPHDGLRAEPYSLVFIGDVVLEQRIYALTHPVLGALEIFLVPIGPDPSGRLQYEAVFN